MEREKVPRGLSGYLMVEGEKERDRERVGELWKDANRSRGKGSAIEEYWKGGLKYLLTRLIEERAEKLKDYAKQHPLDYPFAKTPGWMDRRESRLGQSWDQWLTEAKKQIGVE